MGSCSGSGVCVITVSGSGTFTCPHDTPCEIDCTTMTACSTSTLDCGSASSCTIVCEQMNSCQGTNIDCENVDCAIECQASNTCMNDVITAPAGCTLACEQDSTCDNDNFGPTTAPSPQLTCCADGARCTSNSGILTVNVSNCP